MTLAIVALAAALSGQAPAAPPAATKAASMSVEVRTAVKASAELQAWAKELRAALEARREEFRLAKPAETPEFVVRLDSIGKREDGTPVLNGAFLLGKTTRSFNYGFHDVRTEAEKLARNLRKYADQMKAPPASR
jgi:hypothetical protein